MTVKTAFNLIFNAQNKFKDCKTIFDIVNVINEHIEKNRAKLLHCPMLPDKFSIPHPYDETLVSHRFYSIRKIYITDEYNPDEDSQEVCVIDEFDNETYFEVPTKIQGMTRENLYHLQLLPNGLTFEKFYDCWHLSHESNQLHFIKKYGINYNFAVKSFIQLY